MKSSHEPGSATRQAGPGPRRRPTTLSETVTLLKENSFTLTSADSTTCTSDMAAAPAAPLDAFLTRLETFVKAGMSGQFLKLTGDLVSDISPEALQHHRLSAADTAGQFPFDSIWALHRRPRISCWWPYGAPWRARARRGRGGRSRSLAMACALLAICQRLFLLLRLLLICAVVHVRPSCSGGTLRRASPSTGSAAPTSYSAVTRPTGTTSPYHIDYSTAVQTPSEPNLINLA